MMIMHARGSEDLQKTYSVSESMLNSFESLTDSEK